VVYICIIHRKTQLLLELQVNICLINNYWKDYGQAGKTLMRVGTEKRKDGYNNRDAYCRKEKTGEVFVTG
jgi:hypothetical protein